MAKNRYWNGTAWEVVGTNAEKVEIKDDGGLFTATNVEGALTEIKDDVGRHLAEDASQDNVHGLRGSTLSLGNLSSATGSNAVAIGRNSSASSSSGVAIGNESTARAGISIGLNSVSDSGVSIGFYTISGPTSVSIGHQADSSGSGHGKVAIGRNALSNNGQEGVLGSTVGIYPTNKWIVPGNFTVNGTKNFEIPHPKPSKTATHVIRHGAVESPTAGDTLYRYKIQATKDNDVQVIDLPDYFIHLNKDVQIFVTGQGHFGNGYGVLNKEIEQLEISCQLEGGYNVLVIGTRNDNHQSVQDWDIKGVEREIGESWTGETYQYSVEEIREVEEIKGEY